MLQDMNAEENKQQIQNWVEGFSQSWKTYTEYYLDKLVDKIEDVAACKAVLKEIESGFPAQFVQSYVFDKISEKMLKRAEEFDNNLFHVKMIAMNFDDNEKMKAKFVFRQVESLLALCVKCNAQREGTWEE